MSESIVSLGLELMVFGMGTVFLFLALLVVVTGVMSRFLGKYFPDAEPEVSTVSAAPTAGVDQNLLNVLSQAVKQYRADR